MPQGIYPHKKTDPNIRFWRNVKKTKKCWLWKGYKVTGYGCLYPRKKGMLAHRFSYELHFGKIPKGMLVLHQCDNPPCVNPEHLKAGTYSQNLQEAYDRGLHKMRQGGKYAKSKSTRTNKT